MEFWWRTTDYNSTVFRLHAVRQLLAVERTVRLRPAGNQRQSDARRPAHGDTELRAGQRCTAESGWLTHALAARVLRIERRDRWVNSVVERECVRAAGIAVRSVA